MAIILYNFAISCFRLVLWLICPFHAKAKKMIQGRKQWEARLAEDFKNHHQQVVWFHCASLGEFEQGRPLLDSFKQTYPNCKVLLTFFSPSGYEIRKNYPGAFAVHYLPWDTAANARVFYDLVNPVAAFIIKYEFWYHFIHEGKQRNIPVMICSSIFRGQQIFFKPYGGFFRTILGELRHIFVQDSHSVDLLKNIGVTSVTLAGDTRVDRVASLTREIINDSTVEQFANGRELFIVGSSWPRDIEVLTDLINNEHGLKFVIAPHEIDEPGLNHLESRITRPHVRYTNFRGTAEAEVLIINTIGILSHLYRYGKYAYIGGAFGKGLHNILEAATFGLPLFYGNANYRKFSEARALVELGGAFAIGSKEELFQQFKKLENDRTLYQNAASTCRRYVEEHTGATREILDYVEEHLQLS